MLAGSIDLATKVTGNLPVANLNSGTSASGTTFWRGDGVWATPSGGGGGTIAYSETPSGTVNGSNVTFTLANTPPAAAGVMVVLNGVVQYQGIDYTVSGTTITFTSAPATGSSIFAYYGASGGGAGTVTSVSVVTANGVSGSVANSTTTPAITLSLGAIVPTSVNSVVISGSSTPTLAITGTTAVSGTNTGDQTISLTGEVTGSGTGSFATTLTNSAVIGKVLTGYTSGAGTVAATDTILGAIQKLNGNAANFQKTITSGTAAPSGGVDGDIYLQYT